MVLRTRNSELKTPSVDVNGRSLRAAPSRLSCLELKNTTLLQPIVSRRITDLTTKRPRRSSLTSTSSTGIAKQSCQNVSRNLHTSELSGGVVGRETEIIIIQRILEACLTNDQDCNGSLYISGAPGTGKTATVTQEVRRLTESNRCQSLFINCMQMTTPRAVYSCLLEKVFKEDKLVASGSTEKIITQLEGALEKTISRLPLIMVLDEIDQLASRCQEVLYTIFGWPNILKGGRLILIGIANALDLTERLLPRLQARSLRPNHLAFPPYSKDQIVNIITSRLCQQHKGQSSDTKKQGMDKIAIQFCAKKVAASSGDVRTALAICRRAIDLVRLENQDKLTDGSDENTNPLQRRLLSSPALKRHFTSSSNNTNDKDTEANSELVVPTIRHISQAICEATSSDAIRGSPYNRADGNVEQQSATMPLHHKLVMASCLLLRRLRGVRETGLGALFDIYTHICSLRQLSGLDMAEFVSVCELLDSHCLLRLTKVAESGSRSSIFNTPARMKRVALLLDDKGVEKSLDDNLLLSSVLAIKNLP